MKRHSTVNCVLICNNNYLPLNSLTENPLPKPEPCTPVLRGSEHSPILRHANTLDAANSEGLCHQGTGSAAEEGASNSLPMCDLSHVRTIQAPVKESKLAAGDSPLPKQTHARRKSALLQRTGASSPVGCSCRPRSRSASHSDLPALTGKEGDSLPSLQEKPSSREAVCLASPANTQKRPSRYSARSPRSRRSSANDLVLKGSPSFHHPPQAAAVPQHAPAVTTAAQHNKAAKTLHENGTRSPKSVKATPTKQVLPSWRNTSQQRLVGRQQQQFTRLYRQSAPRASEHTGLNQINPQASIQVRVVNLIYSSNLWSCGDCHNIRAPIRHMPKLQFSFSS